MADAKSAIQPQKNNTAGIKELPGIDLIGPVGTQKFVSSLRHFMRRDAFEVKVREGEYCQSEKARKKKKKRSGGNDEPLYVQSIVCQLEDFNRRIDSMKRQRMEESCCQVLSFIFTTQKLQGKFLVERAKAFGIPPGPLYGQLKSGKPVTFKTEDGQDRIVASSEVVEPGSPGVSVAVLYYPTIECLQQLKSSEKLNEFKKERKDHPILDLIVHMSSYDLFASDESKTWRESFGAALQHVFLNTQLSHDDLPESSIGTPFHSAAIGAISRSKLCSEVYCSPKLPSKLENSTSLTKPTKNDVNETLYKKATPLLEYTLLPRLKRGICNESKYLSNWNTLKYHADNLLENSGAKALAETILKDDPFTAPNGQGELVFTGTGSAVPCKHRNVSGIYLRMENNNSILLDVGEGTVGQLFRCKPGENPNDILLGIKAVWISHPHADHHLGLLCLLAKRKRLTNEPLILIAPPNLMSFLGEYEVVDPIIKGTYTFMDCRDISTKSRPDIWSEARLQNHSSKIEQLQNDLGITSCMSVPVAHCPHAFAIILNNTPFGKGALVYSGDCRPSKPLSFAALNADLLIHEATFADGMEAEASVKRHSTVGEALRVAEQMNAKSVILTHFSQRYPKIPPIANAINQNAPIIFAFDFIKVTPGNLLAASKLTPALRLLHPEQNEEFENELDGAGGEAKAALDIPGLFAQSSLL
jgi:ribonuclease Z